MKKSVLLLTTGGTIASKKSADGLRPQMSANELLGYMDGLGDYFDVDTRELLNMDSSNIQVDEWITIARSIYEALPDYDGIVVTHGTDTMAYTSSMVSFMLQFLRKPVVFTGSQMPIDNLLTDARNNLYTAFEAVRCGIPGVSVAFNRKVMYGCRAVKVRTMGFEAFESVNASYLGEVFADGMHPNVEIPDELQMQQPVRLADKVCRDVFLLKLIPGTDPKVLRMLKDMHYRGIVIEAFGAGGMQFIRTDMLEELKELTASGISVVVCSQCLYEPSDLSIYEVGTRLLSGGVISARALGQTDDPEKVRRIFATNYCGEIRL